MADRNLPRALVLAYAGGTHDRASAQRGDADWIARQLAHRRARLLLVGDPATEGRVALSVDRPRGVAQPYLAPLADVMPAPVEDLLLLGTDGDGPVFALGVEREEAVGLPRLVRWAPVERHAHLLTPAGGGLVAHALAVVEFARTHRFCGTCGGRMLAELGGTTRRCRSCGRRAWSRTDPVVVVLVHDDEGRVLLGRERFSPPRRFGPLAGFVEPGETAEEAAIREVGEEASVLIGDLVPAGTQPWPHPHELLLGYEGRYLEGEPAVGDDELAEVRWFTPADVEHALGGAPGAPFLPPPPGTLARRLLAGRVMPG